MSSLRLALKQSLQETGGGSFSTGHGEKKKRKKKKNAGSVSNSNNNNSNNNTISAGGVCPSGNSTKKGRRNVDSATKRKRGRPRKQHRSEQDHDDDDEIDDATLGDEQPQMRVDSRRDRPRNPRHDHDDEDEVEDDIYSDENEFSYTEDDSDDEVSDEEDVSEDDEYDSPYRRRSRTHQDFDEDEEGEEDEAMHSDDDDFHPQTSKSQSISDETNSIITASAIPFDKMDRKDKISGLYGEKDGVDARNATSSNDGSSSQPKNASQTSSNSVIVSNVSVSSEDEIKKKLKLLKLKKKLEKNQNSAAHKIQTQWKKKKVKGSPSSVSSAEISASTNENGFEKNDVRDNKENTGSMLAKPEARSVALQIQRSMGTTESQNKTPKDNFEASIRHAMVDNQEPNKTSSPEITATKSSSSGNAVAGDRGGTGNPSGAEDQVSSAKKKKKKKNNNGVVPAPTWEVREWSQNMSQKKARKYIQVGMRVKVRFATQAKRDGKTKKIYYGGRVTVVSKRRSKIKIKYDDGTSELSKFPDRDVVVDAVDNGEHSVPADKFLPPSEDQPPEADDVENVQNQDKEEGEIPDPPTADAVVAAAVTEPEEGEVEETPKSEAVTKKPDSSNTADVQTAQDSKNSTVETERSEKLNIESKKSIEAHIAPPSESSLPLVSKKEKTRTSDSTSDIKRKDDLEMERAPSASEEEGEISPGITISKANDSSLGQQRDEITTVEVKPLPLTALFPSKVGIETITTEPIKFAAEKPQFPTSKDEPSSKEDEKSIVKPIPEIPVKPKKLSIRIPSNSLATIKGLSSPKSGGKVKPPKPAPSTSNVATNNIDDVLTDTPESTKELTSKRKRITSDVVPSLDAPSGRELPSKKRIKVVIGKNLLENAVKRDINDNPAKAKSSPNEGTSEEGLVKEELAPIAEESIITAKAKKKIKKTDRSKSPRPKSPLPGPQPDKMTSKNSSFEISSIPVTPKQQKIGSKASAFSAKKSGSREEETAVGTNEAASKTSVSVEIPGTSASLRTGRKAAEEAKEKLTVKQKAKLSAKEKEVTPQESGKKKKKRRREKEAEEHGEEETEDVEQNETEWVQCDACKKWRVLPDNVKASSLPDLWYCRMNIYDPKRSNCEAPEQNMKQILRERKKRARKRAKREAELSEAQHEKPTKKAKLQEEEAVPTTTKKKSKHEKSLAAGGNAPRSISPKPAKSAKSSGAKSKESVTETKKAVTEAKRSNVDGNKKSKSIAEEKPAPADPGSDTQKEIKKKSKKSKKESQDTSESQDADVADSKKSSRKRGRPSRAQPSSSTQPVCTPANGNEDEDNVEWVQCDKCEKWRKLPPDISADELPDVWNCSMNTWNPSAASCDAAEDKTDAHHQEIGASEWQLRQTHAGKYSYRQMIFGTGARKHNRPLSERARAAESLFIQPSTDEDHPHPTTQYNKSSAFLPRISNFQKNLTVEEKNIGIFDVLRKSNLWEELRNMDTNPSKVLSSSTGDMNIPGQKLKTYEFLSDEIKHAMQDVVLQTLEFGCLTGEEVLGKAQWFPYETSIKGIAGIRGYCNEDIIIHTLLDLVRDGLVEMATVRDPFLSVSKWVPQFRRVGTRRAVEAVEAIKASRCMKIAKPWKQRPAAETKSTTEWVTGQKAN